jgi:hypothetical protein
MRDLPGSCGWFQQAQFRVAHNSLTMIGRSHFGALRVLRQVAQARVAERTEFGRQHFPIQK